MIFVSFFWMDLIYSEGMHPWKRFCQNPIVKFLASLKLAILVIVSLVALMIFGTLVESTYGAEYAKWSVYQSWPFLTVEVFLFLNILFATLVRIPFQKRLTGFYITHFGLLLILTGAALTALFGIDGRIELLPNQSNNVILIDEPQLHIRSLTKNSDTKIHSFSLPKTVSEIKNGFSFLYNDYSLIVDQYLPFADYKTKWIETKRSDFSPLHLFLTISNNQATQEIILSNTDSPTQKLGPLHLVLANFINKECFQSMTKQSTSEYFFVTPHQCKPLLKQDNKETSSNLHYTTSTTEKLNLTKINIQDKKNKNSYTFYPELSSSPISENFQIDETGPVKLISLKDWQNHPTIIFLKDNVIAFYKNKNWHFKKIKLAEPLQLPWNSLYLTVKRMIQNKIQKKEWFYKTPQPNQETKLRAARVQIQNSSTEKSEWIWIDNLSSQKISLPDGEEFELAIGPKIKFLPQPVLLNKFEIQTNPGTNQPASFSSYVSVLQNSEKSDHKISMNEPLSLSGYTLYQSSYFPLAESSQYGSVLSVNQDPGRFLKYFGSLLLVSGSMIHFLIRKKIKRQSHEKQHQSFSSSHAVPVSV